MKLKLRGHHLLCIQGFQGYGYSDEFIKNMAHVKEILKGDIEVSVCDFPDDICKCCPNLNGNVCMDKNENEKIVMMDRKVLEKLPKKEFESSDELFEVVNKEFGSKSSATDICGDCSWIEKCLFVLEKTNRFK